MKSFVSNQTEYKSVVVKVKGDMWVISQASGQFNYVQVRKATNNPFSRMGKEFESWDVAKDHYKSPEMKGALDYAKSEMI